jgi:outer membrane protein assembly factor BamB
MSAAEVPAHSAPAQSVTAPAARKPRVIMPLLVIAAYWIGWLAVNVFFPATFTQFMYLFFSPMIIAAVLVIWYLAFSRLAWLDRAWTVLSVAAGGGLAALLCHESMGMGLVMYGLPVALTAVTLWLAILRGAPTLTMRLGLLAASLATWGYFTLLRIDGVDGNLSASRSWRWDETAEQKRLAELGTAVPATPPKVISLTAVSAADWPEFRGPARDGAVRGTHFDPDWKTNPPRELWRRRIGPGWSSFVVVGNVGFTQEQRGDMEAVICFDLETGNQLWEHMDKARFWEVVAGAGPRATPTFHNGKLYSQGASGRLNCLDAATGKPIWSRDILADANPDADKKPKAEQPTPPPWGFASSPLVTHGVAITFAGGKDGKDVLAYDVQTGEPKWHGGKGTHGYSSPQLAVLDGIEQVLMVSDFGLESFDPEDGKVLWDHDWTIQGIFRVCQPHILPGGRIVLATPMNGGTRLLTVARDGAGWKVAEDWTVDDFKPYFNDVVSHDGFLYGFDGDNFTCRDLATGKRQWKKGKYGHGQVLLAADQGQLVVISEKGELILVEANSEKLIERGRIKTLSGKTWNHPVIAGNKLLVRNAEEMACYELAESVPSAATK